MSERFKILFVCGRNQWRSPTAERIYRNDDRVAVRSAGCASTSPRTVTRDDLDWADLVLVMDRSYAERIKAQFPGLADFPPMESLEIPDDYALMDKELIDLISSGTEPYIEAHRAS
jgi:predicted protein tyrosine phosphatase